MLAALFEDIAPGSPFPPSPALFKTALSYTAYSLSMIPLWDGTLAWIPYFSTVVRNRGLDARRAQHTVEMIVLTNGSALPTLYPDYRSWTGKRERFQAFCNVGGLYHMANRFNRTVLQGYADDLDPRLASELELAVTSQQLKLGWCGPLEPDRAEFLKDCAGPRASAPPGGAGWAADDVARSAAGRPAGSSDNWRGAAATARASDPPCSPAVRTSESLGQPAPLIRTAEPSTPSRPLIPEPSVPHTMVATKAHSDKGVESPPQRTVTDGKPEPHGSTAPPRESLWEASVVTTRYSREALRVLLDQERRRWPEAFRTPAGWLRQIQRIAREIVDGARTVPIDQER